MCVYESGSVAPYWLLARLAPAPCSNQSNLRCAQGQRTAMGNSLSLRIARDLPLQGSCTALQRKENVRIHRLKALAYFKIVFGII